MSISLRDLSPFLPGLDHILDDMDVSEIMINGPRNVWVERSGKGLAPLDAPELDADALHRAAIHIARPLGLDPKPSRSLTPGWRTDPAWQSVSLPPPHTPPSPYAGSA